MHKIAAPCLLILGLFLYRIQNSNLANLYRLVNLQEEIFYLSQVYLLNVLAFYSYLQYQNQERHIHKELHFHLKFFVFYLYHLDLEQSMLDIFPREVYLLFVLYIYQMHLFLFCYHIGFLSYISIASCSQQFSISFFLDLINSNSCSLLLFLFL